MARKNFNPDQQSLFPDPPKPPRPKPQKRVELKDEYGIEDVERRLEEMLFADLGEIVQVSGGELFVSDSRTWSEGAKALIKKLTPGREGGVTPEFVDRLAVAKLLLEYKKAKAAASEGVEEEDNEITIRVIDCSKPKVED